MVFFTLLLVPLLVAGGFFLLTKHTIIWQEFLGHVFISCVVAGLSVGLMQCSNTRDQELWSGKVIKKAKEKVSCEHSYCCQTCTRMVCSGSGKSRSCHSQSYCCQTCYRHPYDWDWAYYPDIVGRRTIRRIDSQGNKEPPRWTKVTPGEPYHIIRDYTNYVKAAPETLFKNQGTKKQYQFPTYPGNIHDIYKINRLVTLGVNAPKEYNQLLMEANRDLGHRKEVALGIILVKDKPIDYFSALQEHWVGGKKNDFLVVASVDNELTPQWIEVMAWSTNKLAEVSVRDAIKEIGSFKDPKPVMAAIRKYVNQDFIRKPMKDFEYLKSTVTPSKTQWIVSMLINILASIALGLFMHMNEIQEGWNKRRRW